MLKVNDRKVKENDEIAELCSEHFVSIGEKLAKEIDRPSLNKQNQNLDLERSHR